MDVEGLDYDTLRSNDWSRFRPSFIIAEIHNAITINQANESLTARFLSKENYSIVAKTRNSVIFQHSAPEAR